MAVTQARTPYARLAQEDVALDRELQRIERAGAGLFVPKAITRALSPYTVQATDWMLLVDATGGAVSVVFPAAARMNGLELVVVKTDASANAVTLSATISGVASPTLAAQYKSMTIRAGNGVWYKVAST